MNREEGLCEEDGDPEDWTVPRVEEANNNAGGLKGEVGMTAHDEERVFCRGCAHRRLDFPPPELPQ